jgi:hypothetical protein
MAKKAEKKIEGDVITIKFLETNEELVVDINKIPAETISRLAMHGLSQKLGDSYAGANEGESFAKASAVAGDLIEGNWSTRVAASGPRSTQLAAALAAATGQTLEDCAAKLESMDDDAKKELRAHPQIKMELANIKAKKAQEDAAKAVAAVGDAPAITF